MLLESAPPPEALARLAASLSGARSGAEARRALRQTLHSHPLRLHPDRETGAPHNEQRLLPPIHHEALCGAWASQLTMSG